MSQTRRFTHPVAWAALFSGALLPGCTTGSAPTGAGTGTGTAQQGVEVCPTTPAPALFKNALCVCDDLHLVGASVSTHQTGSSAASIGVNGNAYLVGENNVAGDFTARGGISGVGNLKTSGDIRTAGLFAAVGSIHSGHDLFIGGDLSKVGELIVDGLLRLAGADMEVGDRTIAGTGAYSAVAAPCGCDAATMLDIGKAVAEAKAKNDNDNIGLSSLVQVIGDETIELPTGIYYLDSMKSVGAHKVHVAGAVALYVAGDIEAVGEQTFALADGASLDLYVSGSVRTVGALELGNAANPSLFRLYVGGTDTMIASVGQQQLNGLIYAPQAAIRWVGDTHVRGAVFAKELEGVGTLDISYDGGSLSQPSVCNPKTTVPAPGSDQPAFSIL